MTGWPTHVAGHRTLWSLLQEWEPNLLAYLKEAGYEVRWWGKNDLLAANSWNKSVNSAEMRPGQNMGPHIFRKGDPRAYSFLRGAANGTTSDAANVAAAMKWLRNRPADGPPFVIFLPLHYPHPPYTCPEPFYSSVDPNSLNGTLRPAGLQGSPDYRELIRRFRKFDTLDVGEHDALMRKVHATYLGCVSYSDSLFGEVLDNLDALHLSNSTNVYVWSDHGDYAGDFGLVEKWPSGLEDVLTRVPLLMRGPGVKPGVRHMAPVQLFDIVPTIMEQANLSLKHVQFGKSLVGIANGRSDIHDSKRAVFFEGGYSTHEPRDFEGFLSGLPKVTDPYYPKSLQQLQEPFSVCRAVGIRTSEAKLVLRSDPRSPAHGGELYDLRVDPRELHNLYGTPSAALVQANLTTQLMQWMMQTSDVTRWDLDNRNGQPGNITQARSRVRDVWEYSAMTDGVDVDMSGIVFL